MLGTNSSNVMASKKIKAITVHTVEMLWALKTALLNLGAIVYAWFKFHHDVAVMITVFGLIMMVIDIRIRAMFKAVNILRQEAMERKNRMKAIRPHER